MSDYTQKRIAGAVTINLPSYNYGGCEVILIWMPFHIYAQKRLGLRKWKPWFKFAIHCLDGIYGVLWGFKKTIIRSSQKYRLAC